MSELALLGGKPVISEPLSPYPSMGEAEEQAVVEVVRSGCLSGFYGSPGPEFLGGPKVRAFEDAWAERYGVKHAVSVNSATSGLIAAMGAIGISPGDEVIVPPWTMSATAVAPLFYGGIPVFADIEDQTFCIDPEQVKANITPKTKAIIAVNLFGHPAKLSELRSLADNHGLSLIEDSAQSPLATEDGRFAGTLGDIGIYSLNFHKHIHTGEGGICVTDNDDLAARLQLIRNHGENATDMLKGGDIANIVGMNLRMTELSAAIGLAQIGKADQHVEARERMAEALSIGTKDLEGWAVPVVRDGCRHNYYVWMARYDEAAMGVNRDLFSKALAAEGFPHATGYLPPLYRLPLFQQRKAFGRDGYPFTLSERTYDGALCPVTERLYENQAVLFEPCAFDADETVTTGMIEAVRKVHRLRGDLADA